MSEQSSKHESSLRKTTVKRSSVQSFQEFRSLRDRRRRRHRGELLVVDDSRVTRGKIRVILENLGFQTYTAKTTNEAIALVKELGLEVSCLISAAETNQLSSLENYLKETCPMLPTIVMDSKHNSRSKSNAQSGPVLRLRKPIIPSELRRLVLSVAEPEVLPLAAN